MGGIYILTSLEVGIWIVCNAYLRIDLRGYDLLRVLRDISIVPTLAMCMEDA